MLSTTASSSLSVQQQHQQQQQQQQQSYTVLYYKRTNKIHKNRGTTREDGILTIHPPPSCLVVLKKSDDSADANNDVNDEDDDDDDDDEEEEGKKQRGNKKHKFQKMKRSMAATKVTKRSSDIIWSGANNALAYKVFSKNDGGIEEEEQVVLNAQWECEIVSSCLVSGDDSNSSNVGGGLKGKPLKPLGTTTTNSAKLGLASRRVISQGRTPLVPLRSKLGANGKKAGLASSAASGSGSFGSAAAAAGPNANGPNTSASGTNNGLLKKRPLSSLNPNVNRIGAASAIHSASAKRIAGSVKAANSASGGKMKKDKNGEWYLDKPPSSSDDDSDDDNDDDDDDGGGGGGGGSSSIPASKVPPSLQRKNMIATNNNSSKLNGGIGSGRGKVGGSRLLTTSSRALSNNNSSIQRNTITNHTNTADKSSSNNHQDSTFFPGAMGDKIQVPASIRQILRPHQREGIAFLWNCVTGVSPGLKKAFVASSKSGGGSSSASLSSMDTWNEDEFAGLSESESEDDDDDDDDEVKGCGRANGNNGNGRMLVKDDLDIPRGAVLADEMGLGKTLMTIATIFALHRCQRDRRFIVVCPSSLVSNWAKEFDKWLGKASQPKRITVRNGNEEGLRNLRSFVPLKPNQSEVLILSYELFRLHVKIISKASHIACMVVDEGHRLKNTSGSQTLSALNSIDVESRILITGTPIQNNLSEFYNVANFAVPGILGDLSTFRKLYERPMSQANHKNATGAQKEKGRRQSKNLDAITSTFVLRRLQKDVLKSLLPPRMEFLLFCRPTELQCEMYRDISNRASRSISSIGGVEDGNNPLMLLTEVRKLCTHPALLNKDDLKASSHNASLSGKLVVLERLLQSIRDHHPTDKVVIISNFTSALTVIEESILRKKNLSFVRLDGSLALADRQPLVDSFNNGSVQHSFAFLLSSKAGGCGLNLIGANRLIMVDADWNPATDQQAMARVYRQGQKKKCFIYRMFTTGTVEEVIFQRQTQKGNLAKLANDGGSRGKSKSNKASFTPEELRDCFTLKEGVKCDTKRKLGRKWNDYNGALTLQSQGCMDGPLLDVCEDQSETLSFVRIVDEEEGLAASSRNDESESSDHFSENDESFTSEEEFEG